LVVEELGESCEGLRLLPVEETDECAECHGWDCGDVAENGFE
jgi:hypothetical protein